MKKFLLLVTAVLGFQVCAADAGAEMGKEREVAFTARYIEMADLADGSPLVAAIRGYVGCATDDAKWGATRGIMAKQIEDGFVRRALLFVGDRLVGSCRVGRMPLGVQPWPCEDGSVDQVRLGTIVKFYNWLLSLHGIKPDHLGPVFRTGIEKMPILLVNNAVHAGNVSGVTDGLDFITVQEAVARLMKTSPAVLSPDSNITPAGRPTLIISISKTAPATVDGSPSRVFRMPYYHAEDKDYADVKGMLYTTVTSLLGLPIPELPADIADPLTAYVAALV